MRRNNRATIALCVGLVSAAEVAVGQTPDAARFAFRYSPSQLACATFREQSSATLDAQTGTRQRRETLRREGVLAVRARPAATGLALEAWYDSLSLSRASPEATLVPDTDGLVGGRYRGTLTPSGRYVASVRPFVPDEVAEVAELGGAMNDLLPPLPPVALAVGQRWTDGQGLELRRLADSAAGRRTVRRLALRARTATDRATIRGDTTRVAARQITVEEGEVAWDDRLGLQQRVRRIVVETSVPAGGPLRQPLRSRLEQQGSLVRLPARCDPSTPPP